MVKSVKSVKPVMELMGPPGSGKTTLLELMVHLLNPEGSFLIIDAAPDQGFSSRSIDHDNKPTNGKEAQPSIMTLSQGLDELTAQQKILDQEQIDFFLANLTTAILPTVDVLTVGAPEDKALSPVHQQLLEYGLPRFIEKNYDFVLVDGYHPWIHPHLMREYLKVLMVLSPKTANQLDAQLTHLSTERTEALIWNRASYDPMPESVDTALQHGRFRLVGRLPQFASFEEMLAKMPKMFANCLYRLDLPFERFFLTVETY